MIHAFAQRRFTALLEGAGIKVNGSNPWDITVHNERLYSRIFRTGSLGLGDAYVEGWWDCQALDQFFDRIFRAGFLDRTKYNPVSLLYQFGSRFLNFQTPSRAELNSAKHYDTSNGLFEAMLDPYMQYSCAYFGPNAKTLYKAQQSKMEMICKKLNLSPGMSVLDIGCGWGGLGRWMAEHHGARVTGINLSNNQIQYAKRAAQESWDKGAQSYRYLDYRELLGRGLEFDRIVSVGMLEHVGRRHYGTMMNVVRHCLNPDGIALIHTIGRDSTKVLLPDPWIGRRIFPGGELPTLAQIFAAASGLLTVLDLHEFGNQYDPTLMAWAQNCKDNVWGIQGDRIILPDNFSMRLWLYYLYCAAGAFRANKVRLWQIVMTHPGQKGYKPFRPEV